MIHLFSMQHMITGSCTIDTTMKVRHPPVRRRSAAGQLPRRCHSCGAWLLSEILQLLTRPLL